MGNRVKPVGRNIKNHIHSFTYFERYIISANIVVLPIHGMWCDSHDRANLPFGMMLLTD